jgi:hypothetical protein
MVSSPCHSLAGEGHQDMRIIASLRKRAHGICEAEPRRTDLLTLIQRFQHVAVMGTALVAAALIMMAAEFFRRRFPIVLYISIFLAISISIDRLVQSYYHSRTAGRLGKEAKVGSNYASPVEAHERYFRSGAGG